jgi:hypothetical protein
MYEFTKKRRMSGLGALGFSESWKRPMTTQVVTAPGCSNVTGGRLICGAPSEQQYMSNQGCRSASYEGYEGCTTSSGVNGDLWCCPPGRPGTSASAPIQQVAVSRDNIRALQTWINQQSGCNAGTVDGVYGPATQRGLQCAVAATSWVNVTSRFPFVGTLIATPTGEARPSGFTFDPGTSAKTPEQGGVRTGGGSTVAVQQADSGAPIVQEAGILSQITGALPWWGWLGIAGGVGLLAVLGVALMKGGGEDEEGEAPALKANWTACPMCGSGMVKQVGTEGGKPIRECQTCDYVWAR